MQSAWLTRVLGAAVAAMSCASAAHAVGYGVELGTYYGTNTSGYVGGSIVAQSFTGSKPTGEYYKVGVAARANYGSLGVAVGSAVQNTGSGNPYVYIGGLSKSFWNDNFTVTSGSLAAGTEVLLTLTSIIHIASFAPPGGYPGAPDFPNLPTGWTYGGPDTLSNSMNFGVAFDGWNRNGRDYANYASGDFIGTVTGQHRFSFTKLARVGDTINVNARFEAVAEQYNPLTYSNGFAGAAFHGLGTATTYLDFGSPDVGIVAQSGTIYQNAPGVPEPEIWALLIGGFALVGGAARRRRTVVV